MTFPYESLIYLHGSTCETDIGLTMTLAHELQHFLQYTNERHLWTANTLLMKLPSLPTDDLKACSDFPVEREARITAKKVAENARRGLRRAGEQASGKARAKLAELETLVSRLEQVVAQARSRLSGEMPGGATRLVSLHEPDARPIKKGRIGKPVEFGYLAQVLDNEDGVVVDHSEHVGNPADGPLLAPALGRVKAVASRPPGR